MVQIEKPPKKFLEQFEVKNPKFIVDEFEEQIIKDIYRYDHETLEKISAPERRSNEEIAALLREARHKLLTEGN